MKTTYTIQLRHNALRNPEHGSLIGAGWVSAAQLRGRPPPARDKCLIWRRQQLISAPVQIQTII